MKTWKKPLIMVQSNAEVTKYIRANAGTCINRFLR